MPPSAVSTDRDLRLDLFRGLALWLIFLDHIPSNVVAWITIRNYGFSDATEIFIFISGYTAAFVYGKSMSLNGLLVAGARVWRRAWQIYVAHVFLFAIYLAEIYYVALSFANPLYAEEMNVLDFMKQPDVMIVQALLLKFKPVNMDVLPLYIVLLLMFPPVLWVMLRRPTLALFGSVALYVMMGHFDWNLPSYPQGVWYFNPFAWQLLFVFGAWCALGGAARLADILRSKVVLGLAVLYLIFAFCISLTWYIPSLGPYVPVWLAEHIYPIDKTNLDVLRFVHFLALATVTVYFVPRDWPLLKSRILWPVIVCGQHSLEVFCLGVFLAFAAHFVLTELGHGTALQFLVSLLGILIMFGTAQLTAWYKKMERQPRSRPSDADIAGAGDPV